MRVCVVMVAALMTAATSLWAAAPVIERVDLVRTRDARAFVTPGQSNESGDHFTVLVSDAAGVADVESIAIGASTFATDTSGGGFAWSQPSAQELQLTALIPPNSPDYSASGPYTITVTTASAAQASVSVAKPVLGTAPAMAAPASGYPILHDPAVTFSWSGTNPTADNVLTVTRLSGVSVWTYDAGASASAAYNADGKALDAPLKAGFRYVWKLDSRTVIEDGVTDPRVHISTRDEMGDRFIIYSPTLTVEGVDVFLHTVAQAGGVVYYSTAANFAITDCAGASDIKTGTLTGPDGVVYDPQAPPVGTAWKTSDSFTIQASVSDPLDLSPPPAGAYVVTATDAAGNTATLSTPSVTFPPVPKVVAPADGDVLQGTSVTFQWDPGTTSAPADVSLYEEGISGKIWSTYEAAGNQAVYTPSAPAASLLQAGHTYLWQVTATPTPAAESADEAARVLPEAELWSRFTVYTPWPALPDLPGKLAYGVYLAPGFGRASIEQYAPDPSVRHWIGAVEAEHPDWSPDGTRLAYGGHGLWIDALDGTPPVRITPAADEVTDPHWSPDGSQLVYANYTGSAYDVWIVNADGSDAHLIVSDGNKNRYTTWSPDGQWIAYRKEPADTGTGLWLVHPDGTENHPVAATGVQGYPDYTVGFMAENAWAPDGSRLAVSFDADVTNDKTRPEISGIGVIPAAGGLLRPIFLTPSGVACCAAPKLPTWSPDGTKIVFTSGHQLPFDSGWANGKYESGDELWMINADGSGQPTRLTYDYSLDGATSWWGPNPFSDVPKGTWAYSAISTCKLAGIVTGYPDGYHPSDPVTRDQMAVYIARGLAGGDAEVPTAPAQAVFPDVPADYWAAKYIAYCQDQGIVQGYPDGYHPSDPVTRDQMAVYVSRAVAGGDAKVPAGPDAASFTDVPTSFWAYRYVEYARAQGIVQGYPDGLYHPELVVTRDQMAMFVARAFKLPM